MLISLKHFAASRNFATLRASIKHEADELTFLFAISNVRVAIHFRLLASIEDVPLNFMLLDALAAEMSPVYHQSIPAISTII